MLKASAYFSSLQKAILPHTKIMDRWTTIAFGEPETFSGFLLEVIEASEYILADFKDDDRTSLIERAVYEMFILGLLQLDISRSNPELFAWLTENEFRQAPREDIIRALLAESKGTLVDYDGSYNLERTNKLIGKRRGKFIKCTMRELVSSVEGSIVKNDEPKEVETLDEVYESVTVEKGVGRLVDILSDTELKEAVIRFKQKRRST